MIHLARGTLGLDLLKYTSSRDTTCSFLRLEVDKLIRIKADGFSLEFDTLLQKQTGAAGI